jgi:hypothetical protein
VGRAGAASGESFVAEAGVADDGYGGGEASFWSQGVVGGVGC